MGMMEEAIEEPVTAAEEVDVMPTTGLCRSSASKPASRAVIAAMESA
jgi:hypothetical protein